MSRPQVRIVIADHHEALRNGVRDALEAGEMVVCAEARDAAGALEAVLRERPDICLLDLSLPGGGLAAAKAIAARAPETAVVVLTASSSDDDLFAALRAGAVGYLVKDIPAERLPPTLRGVLAGEAALPRTLVARVLDEFRRRDRSRSLAVRGRRSVVLTEREWEVLESLRSGASTARTAELLGIAPVTVRRHVSAILHKLQVPDRQAALRLLGDDG